jgi:hypothetical protein
MVCSTRNRDYNDPSVQNQGAGQQAGASNQARASQHFNIEAEFRKLQQLVQTKAKEIADLKEQQRKGKQVVVEDDPEEERAERHTHANLEDAGKHHNNAEKQQQKSALEGDKQEAPKNQERQLEVRASRRHEGAPHQSRVEGANPPPVPPLGASKPDNQLATRTTWQRMSRISGTLIIPSRPGSCPMLFLMDSSLQRN